MPQNSTRISNLGRPRALTREQVIDAAIRLGLEDFTMKSVAAELGVTISTLYNYFSDRNELLRLAVNKLLAAMEMPADTGQPWPDYLRQYAQAVGKALLSDSHVLERLVQGGEGFEMEIGLVEQFLLAMTQRGFEPEEALRLTQLIGIQVFGAAVRTHSNRARAKRSGTLQAAFDEAITHYAPEKIPLLSGLNIAMSLDGTALIDELMTQLIEQIARKRGDKV